MSLQQPHVSSKSHLIVGFIMHDAASNCVRAELAFSVSSYDALVAWAAYLDAKGVAHSPMRHVKGVGEVVDLRDPDGIQIELWHRDQAGSWARYVKQKLDQFPSSRG
jgi:predicted enzyme related to lactoylglutathione lyase